MLWAAVVALWCCEGPGERKTISLEKKAIGDIVHHAPDQKTKIFYFGFDLRLTPEEDAKQYIPLLRYLEKATGYQFRIYFLPKGRTVTDCLQNGPVDFAVIGAGSYLYTYTKDGAILMARGKDEYGRDTYRSVIFTRPDSPVRRIKDIRGKRMAFGDKLSTQGHLIPRIVLFEHGITLKDLAGHTYTGSHEFCAREVIEGLADAGGMQDRLAKELAEKGKIRIIHTSKYYPTSGVVARRGVAPKAIAAVRKALLDFDPKGRHAEGLYNWHRTEMSGGFVPAAKDDYAELSHWANRLRIIDLGDQAVE
ncbi:MAG: phosphate/phosphite/phosphonate ABC transporter substrate-binding protein [Thermodesulfobacteriota bacterium]